MQSWYQEAKGHQTPPTRDVLKQTSNLRGDLYRQLPLEGEPMPILVQKVSFTDGPPEGEKIAFLVRKLLAGRTGGTLGMKAEHLKTL